MGFQGFLLLPSPVYVARLLCVQLMTSVFGMRIKLDAQVVVQFFLQLLLLNLLKIDTPFVVMVRAKFAACYIFYARLQLRAEDPAMCTALLISRVYI